MVGRVRCWQMRNLLIISLVVLSACDSARSSSPRDAPCAGWDTYVAPHEEMRQRCQKAYVACMSRRHSVDAVGCVDKNALSTLAARARDVIPRPNYCYPSRYKIDPVYAMRVSLSMVSCHDSISIFKEAFAACVDPESGFARVTAELCQPE
jgi:hypothetical protein